MSRIRTIKPDFWTDSLMVQLPHLTRLIYISLWNLADDHGFLRDEPERIAMEAMPRERVEDVDSSIQLLVATGRLETYAAEDCSTYLRIAHWSDHQRVDHPAKSKISREGSRKFAIPLSVRRDVAKKYGCSPGERVDANCFYCGRQGAVHWAKLSDGRPSGWVTFPDLELDHLVSEHSGGETVHENIVLACRSCNRGKGTKEWLDFFESKSVVNPRESSRVLAPEGKGREGIGEEGNKTPSVPGKPETGGDGTSGNILHLESKLEAKERRLSEVTSEAVETYNLAPFTKRNGGDCPNVSLITDERKKNVGRCLKVASAITEKLTGSPTITRTFWERYWETVSEDPFASGRSKGSGAHANWKPDFEYLTRPDVMGKLFDRAMSEAGVAHG